MAFSVRLDPIAKDLELFIKQGLSPAERSKAFAGYARQELNKAKANNRAALGRETPHMTFVDGAKNRPLEAVKPDGVIVFEFELINDILSWVGRQLVLHSPRLTGRYQDSHMLFADGAEIKAGAPLPAADEYVYLNPLPYARRIERGWSGQAPDGVYEAVAALAKRRFGNMARVTFGYRLPIGTKRARTGPKRGRESHGRRPPDDRRPAIIITPR